MATAQSTSDSPVGRVRRASLVVGGAVLAGLGITLGISGGVGLMALAILAIAAGAYVLGSGRWSQPLGVIVASCYALAIGFVATTPLRGLTPPPGQSRGPMDPATIAVAVGFALAALLIALGERRRENS